MAKTKNFSDFMAICFVFWANISTGLWDPLGCSDLSQIFFGSSPTGIEWDKIVAEIIITTFVFLGHPRHRGSGKVSTPRFLGVLQLKKKLYQLNY